MKRSVFIGSLVTAFALGGAGVWLWQHGQNTETLDTVAAAAPPAPELPAPWIEPTPEPFRALQEMQRQMEQMHQHMQEFFNQDDFFNQAGNAGNFGSWFNTPQGGFATMIQQGEDDDSVFFKIKVGDQDVSNVNVTVENGYVSIDADLSQKSSNAYRRSSVSETFPVPVGVDPDSAKVNKEKDSIVIRFAKVS